MRRITYTILLLLLLLGSFLTGSWYTQRHGAPTNAPGARKVLHYVDPMHPAYKSDKPGIAPDCGMELVPVYEDGTMGSSGPSGTSLPPGTVTVSPEKQQLIGVRVAAVEKIAGSQSLRILGRVATDETRIYRINTAVDGWIRDIHPNSVGSLVKQGEKLASFYAPEFLSAQQAYLYAMGAMDRFVATGKETPEQITLTKVNIQQYKDTLRNLGMSDIQIEEIAHTRQYTENIYVIAPATGFIIARNVSPGQRFEKGAELYRIADLNHVWILADAFGKETQHLRPGVSARITLPDQGETFQAKVSSVLPQFDGTTRTLKVRLETDNPGYVLRPEMFVDVEFPIALPPAIKVPVDAVVDSGTKKTVYVAKGDGVFEPRKVETGWRAGGQVEIVKGLMPGEKIVVSGTFLIDSESRMKAAAAGK
jgi:membrane fusion protein, copper/silver efflux system